MLESDRRDREGVVAYLAVAGRQRDTQQGVVCSGLISATGA